MSNVQTAAPSDNRRRSFYGPGKYRWAVYPDYWKEQWGPKPLLGHVYADDEFYATREAYNRGLLAINHMVEPIKVGTAKPREFRTFTTLNKE